MRLECLDEGLSVQTLHVGPYDDEAPVLDAMHHDFMPSQSLRMTGRHHEIYLGDARRTALDKLGTILRQPVTQHCLPRMEDFCLLWWIHGAEHQGPGHRSARP